MLTLARHNTRQMNSKTYVSSSTIYEDVFDKTLQNPVHLHVCPALENRSPTHLLNANYYLLSAASIIIELVEDN